jgi:hypothetical protein
MDWVEETGPGGAPRRTARGTRPRTIPLATGG